MFSQDWDGVKMSYDYKREMYTSQNINFGGSGSADALSLVMLTLVSLVSSAIRLLSCSYLRDIFNLSTHLSLFFRNLDPIMLPHPNPGMFGKSDTPLLNLVCKKQTLEL